MLKILKNNLRLICAEGVNEHDFIKSVNELPQFYSLEIIC